MRFKSGVKLGEGNIALQGVMAPVFLVADQVYREITGQGVTVTSVCDGTHSAGSLHYKGLAVDLRTTTDGISREKTQEIAVLLKSRLTDEFDVVVEGDHLHVEYDV